MNISNLTFSLVTEHDLPKIETLQPENWNSIIPTIKWYLTLDFCYLVKAVHMGEVVGCGAVLMNQNSAWLANIIVAKSHRNKGFGKTITGHLLTYAKQHTDSILLIATKLGYPVYLQYGFKADEEYVFFKPGKILVPQSPNIFRYQPKWKQAILELDADTFGEQRSQLLESRLAESFVYVKDGTVKGFTIPTLGEGLTVATTAEAGTALMALRFSEEKRACLPKANTDAIHFLKEHGFEVDEVLFGVKMYLDNKPLWKPQQQFGRIGGNMG
jgi:GNAT superfamily N-acetyltransferase